jgi:hypothetical protein
MLAPERLPQLQKYNFDLEPIPADRWHALLLPGVPSAYWNRLLLQSLIAP